MTYRSTLNAEAASSAQRHTMAPREEIIAKSICVAINGDERQHSFLARLPAHFHTYWMELARVREDLFKILRDEWHIHDSDYKSSFHDKSNEAGGLKSKGDMGFSGSTFYTTSDAAFLVKSVPRKFEHSFFEHDLLQPYVEHMKQNQASLLVRITSFLGNSHTTVGSTLGLAPTHHIVMENILYGQEDTSTDVKCESYDLKPLSYFYPERDVADGAFSNEEALSKLADKFDDKIVLTLDQAEEFKAQLEKDTALLARCNAVDYSLMLVRIPVDGAPKSEDQPALSKDESSKNPIPPVQPPFTPPGPPSWRTGIESQDGRWIYRASVLDFFWAKHKATPFLMTGLIKAYNTIDRQGPMSITTNAAEYRDRFLKMCKNMIEVMDETSKPHL